MVFVQVNRLHKGLVVGITGPEREAEALERHGRGRALVLGSAGPFLWRPDRSE
jgi:hypothetical protein